MKKFILLVGVLVFLSGCDPNVFRWELDFYNEKCKENGGLYSIDNLGRYGVCGNGKMVRYNTSDVVWEGS